VLPTGIVRVVVEEYRTLAAPLRIRLAPPPAGVVGIFIVNVAGACATQLEPDKLYPELQVILTVSVPGVNVPFEQAKIVVAVPVPFVTVIGLVSEMFHPLVSACTEYPLIVVAAQLAGVGGGVT
jgi:hypothetical protein